MVLGAVGVVVVLLGVSVSLARSHRDAARAERKEAAGRFVEAYARHDVAGAYARLLPAVRRMIPIGAWRLCGFDAIGSQFLIGTVDPLRPIRADAVGEPREEVPLGVSGSATVVDVSLTFTDRSGRQGGTVIAVADGVGGPFVVPGPNPMTEIVHGKAMSVNGCSTTRVKPPTQAECEEEYLQVRAAVLAYGDDPDHQTEPSSVDLGEGGRYLPAMPIDYDVFQGEISLSDTGRSYGCHPSYGDGGLTGLAPGSAYGVVLGPCAAEGQRVHVSGSITNNTSRAQRFRVRIEVSDASGRLFLFAGLTPRPVPPYSSGPWAGDSVRLVRQGTVPTCELVSVAFAG